MGVAPALSAVVTRDVSLSVKVTRKSTRTAAEAEAATIQMDCHEWTVAPVADVVEYRSTTAPESQEPTNMPAP